jgi:CHAD domain-containing protein
MSMAIAGTGMEIEAKFTVPDDAAFENLRALDTLGEYRLVSPRDHAVADHYFDTPGRDLLRGGFACRRRVDDSGGPEIVTVKGLDDARGAMHRRPEHEIQVRPDAPPGQWPAGTARNIVLEHAGENPLVELLTVNQRRTIRDVMREDRRVAALSLDRIEFGPGERALELEIEIASDADGADLRALTKLLRPFGLRPPPLSKFERAVALLDGRDSGPAGHAEAGARSRPAAAPSGRRATAKARSRPARKVKRMGVRADDPMAEAGRKILRYHWEQALAHEAGTVAGEDPEELHDMRVATRRQRAALRIVGPHCRRKTLRPVRDGLRALGGSLGAVRDLDVLLAAASAYQATLETTEAAAFQGLLDAWARRREAARVKMVEYLGGHAHAEFKERYTGFLDTPGAGVRAGAGEGAPRAALVAHVVPSEIWAHYGALCAFGKVLPWASAETLHALRIEGKRLRYLLEFFREVLDRSVEKAIAAIVALQDHLGELQDAVVTSGLVGEFLAGPEALANPGAAAAATRYRDSRQDRIRELRRGLDRSWSGVTGSAFKSCISRAAAGL